MTFTRARIALAGLAFIALIAAGCTAEEDAAAAGTPTASVTSSASPPTTATGIATDTGEPIASTHAIPTADLPMVRFTSTAGREATLPIEVI
ncbi:MAG: hypothetical protein Q8M79_08955, partial [Dehalococcoidia bacterium]|nr:hypothetical protein [Dehalococcoidia bacterium]